MDKDKFWNVMYSEPSKKWGRKYYIHLKGEQYARLMGVVDWLLIVVSRDTDKHTFYKTDWYGFNDSFIRRFPLATIIIKQRNPKKTFKTTVQDVVANWKYLTFSTEGFETQIIMPKSLLETVLEKKSKKV